MKHVILFTSVWAFVVTVVFPFHVEDCGKICFSHCLEDIMILLFKRTQIMQKTGKSLSIPVMKKI